MVVFPFYLVWLYVEGEVVGLEVGVSDDSLKHRDTISETLEIDLCIQERDLSEIL